MVLGSVAPCARITALIALSPADNDNTRELDAFLTVEREQREALIVALCAPSKNRRLACEANTSSSARAGNIQIRINSGNAWVCVAKKGGLVAALRTSVTHSHLCRGQR
jgi:hypothetical protein